MQSTQEVYLQDLERKIRRQLKLINIIKWQKYKRRTLSRLVDAFHRSYAEYRAKGGKPLHVY